MRVKARVRSSVGARVRVRIRAGVRVQVTIGDDTRGRARARLIIAALLNISCRSDN